MPRKTQRGQVARKGKGMTAAKKARMMMKKQQMADKPPNHQLET